MKGCTKAIIATSIASILSTSYAAITERPIAGKVYDDVLIHEGTFQDSDLGITKNYYFNGGVIFDASENELVPAVLVHNWGSSKNTPGYYDTKSNFIIGNGKDFIAKNYRGYSDLQVNEGTTLSIEGKGKVILESGMIDNEDFDPSQSAIDVEDYGRLEIRSQSMSIHNKRDDRCNAGSIFTVNSGAIDIDLSKTFVEEKVSFGIFADAPGENTETKVKINADEGINISTYFRDGIPLSEYDLQGAGIYLQAPSLKAKTSSILESKNGSVNVDAQSFGYYSFGNVNSRIISKDKNVVILGRLKPGIFLEAGADYTEENVLEIYAGNNVKISSDNDIGVKLYGVNEDDNLLLNINAGNDLSVVGDEYGIYSQYGKVRTYSKLLSITTKKNQRSLYILKGSSVISTVEDIATIYDETFVDGGTFSLTSPTSIFKNKISAINGGTIKLESLTSFGASLDCDPANPIMVADTNSSIKGVFGRSVIDGTISSKHGSLLDLSLSHGSIFTGATSNGAETASEGSINLSLEGSSKWRLSDNSSMSKLVLTNSSIDFSALQSNPLTHQYRNLKTRALEGSNGTLHMSIDLEKESAENFTLDQLDILGNASGSLKVGLSIQGEEFPENKSHSNNWLVAQGSGSNLTITNLFGGSTFSGRGMVTVWNLGFVKEGDEALLDTDEGRQQISTQTNGNDKGKWYLVKSENSQPDPGPSPDPTPNPNPPTPPLPPEVDDNITIGTSSGQAEAYQADMEDLRKRTGEVRYGAQDGGWVSVFGKKDSVKASGTAGFKQEIYGLNIGVDRLVHADEDSAWLLGGAFRYSNADQKGLGSGYTTGTLQEYSGKLYATWMHDKGSYANFVLQAGRYEQELEGFDNTGMDKSKADYGTWGFSASVEVGHMFSFDGGVDDRRWFNHWFVEPQLQLSYFLAKGADYTTSTGLKVDQGNADFLTGRAGFVLGKKFNYGTIDDQDRRYFQVALLGGVKHEFLGGDQTISYTGVDGAKASVHAGDIDGTRFYYGVNCDWQVTDNFRLYAQASREEGDRYTKDYDISIGGKQLF